MKRILIVRQHNQLGDMLCVIPLLSALASRYPGSELTLVCSPDNFDIMRHHSLLRHVVCYDKREFSPFRVMPLFGFLHALRRLRYDLAIVPSTVSVSSTSNLLALLSGAEQTIGPVSVEGRRNFWGRYFDVSVDLDWSGAPHRHQTLRNIDIAASLSLDVPSQECLITLTEEERSEGKERMIRLRGNHSTVVVFHPGAGKAPNRWPAERFAALADSVAANIDAALLVTNGPMDEAVVRGMVGRVTSSIEVLPRMPIRQVAALLAYADLVVSNDTGIMHVAASVGTPVLSLFGPTDPLQWAPVGAKHRYLHGAGGRIDEIQTDHVTHTVFEMLRGEGRE